VVLRDAAIELLRRDPSRGSPDRAGRLMGDPAAFGEHVSQGEKEGR